jgi:hypothetical protein
MLTWQAILLFSGIADIVDFLMLMVYILLLSFLSRDPRCYMVRIYSLHHESRGVTYLMPGEALDAAIAIMQQYQPGEYDYTGETRELPIDMSAFDGKPLAMLTADRMVNPRPQVELGMENCQIH